VINPIERQGCPGLKLVQNQQRSPKLLDPVGGLKVSINGQEKANGKGSIYGVSEDPGKSWCVREEGVFGFKKTFKKKKKKVKREKAKH